MAGTVPAFKTLLAGTIPALKTLLAGTIPAYKTLLAGINDFFWGLFYDLSAELEITFSPKGDIL